MTHDFFTLVGIALEADLHFRNGYSDDRVKCWLATRAATRMRLAIRHAFPSMDHYSVDRNCNLGFAG